MTETEPPRPPEATPAAGTSTENPRLYVYRRPEILVNVWGFFFLVGYLGWRGATVDSVTLLACLGLFCIWTESAALERRLKIFSNALGRKHREDDLLPFFGALGGIVMTRLSMVSSHLAAGLVVPAGMAAGAFLIVLLTSLDWRRSLLAMITVVYDGTGGIILRISVTLSIWILLLRP